MIVKLHGTSGSGKSTVARFLLNQGPVTLLPELNRRPEGYMVEIAKLDKPLYVLGPYIATCGGLDSIPNVDDHIMLLDKYVDQGHVFYEGLLQSEYYGRIGKITERWGDDHIFAFLDTPLDLCLERVRRRREDRGNTKPLDPTNTSLRIKKIQTLKNKLEHGLGIPKRRVVTIPHDDAGPAVLRLFGGS